ncbi:hypothetical protein BsWGS_14419 [Bradybaena similaris]
MEKKEARVFDLFIVQDFVLFTIPAFMSTDNDFGRNVHVYLVSFPLVGPPGHILCSLAKKYSMVVCATGHQHLTRTSVHHHHHVPLENVFLTAKTLTQMKNGYQKVFWEVNTGADYIIICLILTTSPIKCP